MDLLYDDRACPRTQAPMLLVLLPGIHMTPAEMQREGMIAAVRQRGLAADVMAVDAHIGYVRDGSVMRRLHDDVFEPARRWGYRRFWIAGISLGGYLALHYAREHPGEVEGVFAIAPYLGRPEVIAAAGRGVAQLPGDDIDARLWRWLLAPSNAPQLWLGYGREDRLAEGHRLLASTLPPQRVSVVPGRHVWAPWRTLWSQWLDRQLLPAHCS